MNEQQRLSDRDIRAAFERRSNGTPSLELADTIKSTARTSRQARHLAVVPALGLRADRRLALVAAVAVTSLAVAGGLVVGGLRDRPTPSEPVPTIPAPSVGPSIPPIGAPALYAADDAILPIASQAAYEAPGGATLEGALGMFDPGQPLVVVHGPALVDDVEWYLLAPADALTDAPTAWAPVTTPDGVSNLFEDARLACPAGEVEASATDLGAGYVACYDFDDLLRIRGTVTCAVDAPTGISGPAWARSSGVCRLDGPAGLALYGPAVDPLLAEAADAENGEIGRWLILGHVDDRDAVDCGDSDDPSPTTQPLAVLECRMALVVDEAQRIGAGGEPSPSLGPSPSVRPTVRPDGTIEPDTFVTVSSAGPAPVSAEPGGAQIDVGYPLAFSAGNPLVVVDGPQIVDGREWYFVAPAIRLIDTLPGWVPLTDEAGAALLEPASFECPSLPLTAAKLDGPPAILGTALALCFGNAEITMTGGLTCGAMSEPTFGGPAFVEQGWICLLQTEATTVPIYGIPSSIDGGTWSVVGHFDDPAAGDCRFLDPGDSPLESDPLRAVVNCRASFVATTWEAGG